MIVLKCLRCGSTDLIEFDEEINEVFCNGCDSVMDSDMECELIEMQENEK